MLVPVEVEELEPFDNEYVYDIGMVESPHTFFADGILVHNSVYFDIAPFTRQVCPVDLVWSPANVRKISKLVEDFVSRVNVECCRIAEEDFHTPLKRIEFKLETVCSQGVFLAKKRYVLHVLYSEGALVDEFKYTGVDVKKNEIPEAIKGILREVIEGSMKEVWTSKRYRQTLEEAWEKFKNMRPEDIAFIKNLSTEKESTGFLQTEKGAGPHARGAVYFNQIIGKMGLKNKYDEIRHGDRLHYVHVKKSNQFGIDVISWADVFPAEFAEMFQIDHGLMFEKVVVAPLKRFQDLNGWSSFRPNEAVLFEVADL